MNSFEMMHGYGFDPGFGLMGIIFMILQLLFWAALVYLIFVAIKKLNTSGSDGDKDDDSLLILRKRYAKGEISEEEFKKMKEDLME